MTGRRDIEDERTLLAELGRYVHLARADVKHQKISRKAAAANRHADPQQLGHAAADPARDRPRRRKSQAASSIWITFKGAVARMVPRNSPKEMAKQAAFRRARSAKQRTAAVTAAEAYFESALTQAKDASLDEEATEAYLQEQQQVAAKLLRKAPVGAHLAELLGASSVHPNTVGSALPDDAEQRSLVANCVVRERVLVGDGMEDGQIDPVEEADVFLQRAATILTHHEKKIVSDSGVLHDIAPTQCIIRIKNSGRRKQTSIITNQKSSLLFRTNFAALLRKDVAPLLHQHKDEASAEEKKAAAPSSLAAKKAPVSSPTKGNTKKK